MAVSQFYYEKHTQKSLVFTKLARNNSIHQVFGIPNKCNTIRMAFVDHVYCKTVSAGLRTRNFSLYKLLADMMTITSQFLHSHRAPRLQILLEASGTKETDCIQYLCYTVFVHRKQTCHQVIFTQILQSKP